MKLTRLTRLALSLLCVAAAVSLSACRAPETGPPKKVAALVADWFARSHPDVIISRIPKTYTLDGRGEPSRLRLVSVYRDKPTDKDLCTEMARQYDFKVCESISDALTLGTGPPATQRAGKLAVDGVIISTEWAPYPVSPTGQTMYPHRRMFEEIVKVFRESGRVVPVFVDKHLADTWADSKWIYDTAREMGVPLMAGSSLPVAWRRPPADVTPEAKLEEIFAISYHTLDGYGFHAMEMVQCLAEQRKGGESGIKSVQCLVGDEVWKAAGKLYDPALLDAALSRMEHKLPEGKKLQELVKEPVLFSMEYADGLRASVLTLNYVVQEWTVAWRYEGGRTESTLFWLQSALPVMHFAHQMKGVEEMILTGRPSWPVERTLLTSGALDALLISKKEGGKRIETPQLMFGYKADWRWRQPPEPLSATKPQ